MSTLKTCPICGDPMKQGQRQGTLKGGSKAHGICAETMDTQPPGGPLEEPEVEEAPVAPREMADEEFVELFTPLVTGLVKGLLGPVVRATLEPGLDERIRDAAIDAVAQLNVPPPAPESKSSQLARLMTDAGDRLMKRTLAGSEDPNADNHLVVQDIREMARSATVLRVVALYISEAS